MCDFHKNEIMPSIDEDLLTLSRIGLLKELMVLRTAIRYARDQVKDNKCWFDFIRLVELLPEGVRHSDKMLDKAQMLSNCETFIDCMKVYLDNPNSSIDEVYKIWEKVCPYRDSI